MLAQDLAIPAMFPTLSHDAADALHHASAYLANPGNYSVSGFIGSDPVGSFGSTSTSQRYNCGGGCYGSAFLFQRYMRDRFGGDNYTRGMETGSAVGYANLQNNRACSETGTQLLEDFAMAMGTNTLGVRSTDPRFSFGSLNLLGTYNDQFGSKYHHARRFHNAVRCQRVGNGAGARGRIRLCFTREYPGHRRAGDHQRYKCSDWVCFSGWAGRALTDLS